MATGLKMRLLNLSILIGLCLAVNAKTLKVDTITPSVTNGDLTISRDGTGNIVLDNFSGLLKASTGVISTGQADLSSEVTGTLPIANGGTGATSFTENSVIFSGSSGVFTEDNTNFIWDNVSKILTVIGEFVIDNLSLNGNTISSTDVNGNILLVPNGTGTVNVASDLLMTGTGALDLPVGTEGERPTPNSGMIRFNSDTTGFEGYNGSAWGSLGGGAGTKNIIIQETYESAIKASDFTCGANLTATDETTNPINDLNSIDIDQGATPTTDGFGCSSSAYTLPIKARGKFLGACVYTQWDGNDNEFSFRVFDNTNLAFLGSVGITASTEPKEHCLYFNSATDTASIDFFFVADTANNNTTLRLDDVQLVVDPLTPTNIYASSEWEDCGMTASDFSAAFGSVTNITDSCKREGTDLVINVRFDPGTVTGGAAQITPRYNGNTIVIDDSVQAKAPYGESIRDSASVANDSVVLLTAGLSYVEFGPKNSTSAGPLSARPADEICATGGACHFWARVPIAGWSNTSQGVVVKNRTDSASTENDWFAEVNTPTCGTSSSKEYPQEWLSCISSGSDTCTCTYDSSIFPSSTPPHIQCTSTTVQDVACDSFSGNTFRVLCQNNSGASNVACDVNIKATKSKDDFIKETDKVYTVPVDSLTGNSVRAAGNAGESITASVTDIPFAEIVDTANAWDGDSYTVQKNGSTISLSGTVHFTTAQGDVVDLYLNGSSYKRLSPIISSFNASFNTTLKDLSEGDVLSLRYSGSCGGTCTLTTSSTLHHLEITEEYGDRGIFLGKFGQPTCYVKEIQANTVDSTTALSAGSFVKNTLNTTEGSCSFLSLASSAITLEQGSYNVKCNVPVHRNDSTSIYYRWKTQFYNTSDSTTAIIGSSASMRNSGNVGGGIDTPSIPLMGSINISSSKDFELRTYVNNVTGAKIGDTASASISEVYSQCEITKVR